MGDVALPPWAADVADCVAQLAAALESPHVSARLHHWIDLVFGCASRGAPAERADNVFHYLTYDDMCAGLGLYLGMIYQKKKPLDRPGLWLRQPRRRGQARRRCNPLPHLRRHVQACTNGANKS